MSNLYAVFQSPLKQTEGAPNDNISLDPTLLSTVASLLDADFVVFTKASDGTWKKITFANFKTEIAAVLAESDPVFLASAAAGIEAGDIANWDEAHGWGDHAGGGYLDETAHDVTARHTLGDVVPHDALSALTDLVLGTLADNNLLAYDSVTEKWINQTAVAAGLATAAHTQGVNKGGTGQDFSAGTGFLYISGGVASLVSTPSLPTGTKMFIPLTLTGNIVATDADNVGFMQAQMLIPAGFTKITGLRVTGTGGVSGSAGASVLHLSNAGYGGAGSVIELSLAGTASSGSASGEIAVTPSVDSVYLFVASGNGYHSTLNCIAEVTV